MSIVRPMTWLLVGIGIACADTNPRDLTADRRAALRDSIAAFSEAMFATARERDVEGILALYSGGPHFTHVDNGVVVDWPTLEVGIRNTFEQLAENEIRWVEPPRVALLDADVAVVVGRHRFEGGAGIPPHDGVWTGVLQRIEGSWKIVNTHSSDVPVQSDAQP